MRIPSSPYRVHSARRANSTDAPGAGLAVVVMMPRDSARRAAFVDRAFAASELISEVLFADSCFLRDPAERELVLGTRNFSHLRCPVWISMAEKRVGTWAAQMRGLEIAARRSGPTIMLEDDVHFAAEDFAKHIPRVVRLADDADLVYLGSCYERLDLVEQCEAVAAGLFAFRPVHATCAHAWLLRPAGALNVLRSTQSYLDTLHKTTAQVQPPLDCSRAYTVDPGLVASSGDTALLPIWKSHVQMGFDTMVRIAYQSSRIRALHIWPQLVFQASGARLVDKSFQYQQPPQACLPPSASGRERPDIPGDGHRRHRLLRKPAKQPRHSNIPQ